MNALHFDNDEHKQMGIDVFKGTALACDDYKACQEHRSFSSSQRAYRSVTISSQSALTQHTSLCNTQELISCLCKCVLLRRVCDIVNAALHFARDFVCNSWICVTF